MKRKIYEIIMDDNAVNFAPENEDREIVQNVISICTTPKGSKALDREFGINPLVIDAPMRTETARITQEIYDAVKKYEPRASIIEVSLQWSEQKASLWPAVKFTAKK